MINQHDFCAAGYSQVEGKKGFRWFPIEWESKRIQPQFLMALKDAKPHVGAFKCATRGIARTTDSRSAIGALVPDFPCGDTIGVLRAHAELGWMVPLVYNSFVFDWMLRQRIASARVNYFVLEEMPLIRIADGLAIASLRNIAQHVLLPGLNFAPLWKPVPGRSWRQCWAVTRSERLRLRAITEAVVAYFYGLTCAEFAHITIGCDYPAKQLDSRETRVRLDPKGFWRFEKAYEPEHRLAVMAQIAFHDLAETGIAGFLSQNDGEGWVLPETVRLADYGLGHDDRAKEYQLVASALGLRFYPWQLEQSVEESWEECEHHAEILAKLLLPPDPGKSTNTEGNGDVAVDLFGNPVETDLFGSPVYPELRKR